MCMSDFWIQEDDTCDYASHIRNRDMSGPNIR